MNILSFQSFITNASYEFEILHSDNLWRESKRINDITKAFIKNGGVCIDDILHIEQLIKNTSLRTKTHKSLTLYQYSNHGHVYWVSSKSHRWHDEDKYMRLYIVGTPKIGEPK